MIEVIGVYYDGKSSAEVPVRIAFHNDGMLTIEGRGVTLRYPIDHVRIGPRVANTHRNILLPGRGRCATQDNASIDAYLRETGKQPLTRLVHQLESYSVASAAAVLLVIACVWATAHYGIPRLAKYVAFSIPAEAEQVFVKNSLDALDKFSFFGPSILSDRRRASLRKVFVQLADDAQPPSGYRLEFRHGTAMGANALAFPGGVVLITDELVALAKNDDQIAAILAHEIGHQRGRHFVRSLLEGSAAALLVAFVSGDITSISSAAAGVPTILFRLEFARDHEREADDYAMDIMRRHNIPLESFANILQRLEKEHGGTNIPNYLSTHPKTLNRTKRFRQLK